MNFFDTSILSVPLSLDLLQLARYLSPLLLVVSDGSLGACRSVACTLSRAARVQTFSRI